MKRKPLSIKRLTIEYLPGYLEELYKEKHEYVKEHYRGLNNMQLQAEAMALVELERRELQKFITYIWKNPK